MSKGLIGEIPESMSDQRMVLSVLTAPNHVNYGNTVHGGFLLKWMDEAAYVCAAMYCGGYAVTAAFDKVQFLEPMFIGERLDFYASVDFTGRTSMDISINVMAIDIKKKTFRLVSTSFVTMVAVDDGKRPISVTPFIAQTKNEKKRFEVARLRREFAQRYSMKIKEVE